MPKRKNKLNRTDRLRRDTAHIEPHKGLEIVEGSFQVITINKDWQVHTQRRGNKAFLARLPEYLQYTRRIRIEILCRDPGDRRAHEDTARKTELLTNIRDLLNKSNDIDSVEVIFYIKREENSDPYIPQLQAVIPPHTPNFTEWTLQCHWRRGPKIIKVKRDSELERKITTHPWLNLRHGSLLIIKIDHTKKHRLRKNIKYVDEREELQESFFKILPLFLNQAAEIRIEVTPLKPQYLLVRMFQNDKKMIERMVLLVNEYWKVERIKVVFRVDERKTNYSNFASCFADLKPAWKLLVVIDKENRRGIPLGSLVSRRIR
ncbi:uncharacterized protein EAE98_005918 [Botrytis deweyae]|uniref:THUMP domain-containing protein n=1 Tax=Botrytis deweyae TaxID=2478750 RepID=A0ABQ7IL66_9HELO|nr:uncharacterized protein EAE98_005918 [Botrytis deweyae]KAF7927536.1 hypothetical protein EAE98_005918 [Botrytis deweyae]